MEIAIRGRNTEIPNPVHDAARAKVSHLSRFLEGMERAEVRFTEERNPRISDREICEVTMVGHGHIVRARAAARDQLGALDRVLDKLEQRLHKLKGRLVARSHPRQSAVARGGAVVVEETPEATGMSRIVRTKQFGMQPVRPIEAVLQMDLLGHDFYLFTNVETDRAAVVYRRRDGDIGLIEAG